MENSLISCRLQEINKRCRKVYGENGEQIRVSVSIGAFICKGSNWTYDIMYQCADQALYRTKEKGKDGYTIYNEM